MMFALLVLLTLAVSALPLLPAWQEWRRPRDVAPLQIDATDTLDPPFLAHCFAERLANALRSGAPSLGTSALVVVQTQADAPTDRLQALLLPAETAAGRSERIWHVPGSADLPPLMDFHAEISATGTLRSAPGRVYRALLASAALQLAPRTTILRWAHASQISVAEDCHLAGRTTAQSTLTVALGVTFQLLHAPVIAFGAKPAPREMAAPTTLARWDSAVAWDEDQRRGVATAALHVAAGQAWRGDLVGLADLYLGENCCVTGSLKAHGALRLGRGCRVEGSIFAAGPIHLAEHCAIAGSVMSEASVTLGPGCSVGAPDQLATLAAPQLLIATGTVVCGTVWAEAQGQTFSSTHSTDLP